MIADDDYYLLIAENAKKSMIKDMFHACAVKNLDFLQIAQKQTKIKDIFTDKYLPFHLCDENWLKKYIAAFYVRVDLNQYIDENSVVRNKVNRERLVNNFLNFNNIEKFVQNIYKNNLFQQKLKYYKNQIIYTQIEQLMRSQTVEKTSDFDKNFRATVIKKIQSLELGIPLQEIEKFIEINSQWWRKEVMVQTFENKYYPQEVINCFRMKSPNWKARLYDFKIKHRNLWLEKREVDYYHEFIQGKPELEDIYTDSRIISPGNQEKLQLCEKKYQHIIKNYCQKQKKLSNINYKPLLLSLGFRTKETVKKRKRLNLNNAGELKKISLFESFYHNDSKWTKNKELNQLSQTSNNEKC